MRITAWAKHETPDYEQSNPKAMMLSDRIITRFEFTTVDAFNANELVRYLNGFIPEAYDELINQKKRLATAHKAWEGYSPEQIILKLNSLLCDNSQDKPTDRVDVRGDNLNKMIIDIGIQILRDVYKVFYTPDMEVPEKYKHEYTCKPFVSGKVVE